MYLRRNSDTSGLLSDSGEGIVIDNYEPAGRYLLLDKVNTPGGGYMEGVSAWSSPEMPPPSFSFFSCDNDYVACFCPGEFSQERANTIVANNNKHLRYYITYDTSLLLKAIHRSLVASKIIKWRPIADIFLGRKVLYDNREATHLLSTLFSGTLPGGDLNSWERTVFVKPPKYRHECEYRVVLLTGKPGQVPANAPYLEVASPEIEKSIYRLGEI